MSTARGTHETDEADETGETGEARGSERGRGRRGPRRRGRSVLVVLLAVAVLLLVARAGLLPGLPDPFSEKTRDRSGPAVLKSIQDMSRYEAASGNFQVVVDLEKDARFLPDAVRGKRTLYVGAGSVGAYVDLGRVGKDAVKVDEDRTSAEIILPRAQLERPSLDPERSYVVAQNRGLFDRIEDFFSANPGDHQEMNELAAQKIGAAAEESDLRKRAESNTRSMLVGLLTSLGFTDVTVEFSGKG
ncbi:DUF4230 domain-containing protein [Streptomyces thermolineatus]|uniref:DUF4230 domain-containing protein n=1 Tax=Streptomyces thermolineatus TaxID=44033 RepID=A0ABP5ZE26_9ACTN